MTSVSIVDYLNLFMKETTENALTGKLNGKIYRIDPSLNDERNSIDNGYFLHDIDSIIGVFPLAQNISNQFHHNCQFRFSTVPTFRGKVSKDLHIQNEPIDYFQYRLGSISGDSFHVHLMFPTYELLYIQII